MLYLLIIEGIVALFVGRILGVSLEYFMEFLLFINGLIIVIVVFVVIGAKILFG